MPETNLARAGAPRNTGPIRKWVRRALVVILALYGLVILATGLLSYDIAFLLRAPFGSVGRLQLFSLMLGAFSISLAALLAVPKTHRRKLTLALLLMVPAVVLSGQFAYQAQYRAAYAGFPAVEPPGHEQIASFNPVDSPYSTNSLQAALGRGLEHTKRETLRFREFLYSLPVKKKFSEGMDGAKKEMEYFSKKQEEVNAAQRPKPGKQENSP